MKKLFAGMLALASFIFSANAQDMGKMKHHQHHHGKTMMKGITFSETQKEQLKAARESTKSQLMELNKNEDITVREYKTRKSAIMRSQKEQMDKVLTPEQKNQIAQNKKDRESKHASAMAKRIDKMKSHLNLSDGQVARMKANREAAMAKVKAIKENSQLSPEDRRAQMTALRQEQKNSFKEILTQEQISKMEEMKKERVDKKSRK